MKSSILKTHGFNKRSYDKFGQSLTFEKELPIDPFKISLPTEQLSKKL